MGLFGKKKKNNNDSEFWGASKFENADASDDAFLVSAVSSGGISDDVFETPSEVLDKTRGYGANSGLAYVNKYSSTNQKLATTKVVDVGAFKKPVKEEPKPASPPSVKPADKTKSSDDVLFEPIKEDGENSEDDSDFDSFFEEFMKKNSADKKTEEKNPTVIIQEPEEVKKPKPASPKKPVTKRKKKRAIDIDIISGGVGGDII